MSVSTLGGVRFVPVAHWAVACRRRSGALIGCRWDTLAPLSASMPVAGDSAPDRSRPVCTMSVAEPSGPICGVEEVGIARGLSSKGSEPLGVVVEGVGIARGCRRRGRNRSGLSSINLGCAVAGRLLIAPGGPPDSMRDSTTLDPSDQSTTSRVERRPRSPSTASEVALGRAKWGDRRWAGPPGSTVLVRWRAYRHGIAADPSGQRLRAPKRDFAHRRRRAKSRCDARSGTGRAGAARSKRHRRRGGSSPTGRRLRALKGDFAHRRRRAKSRRDARSGHGERLVSREGWGRPSSGANDHGGHELAQPRTRCGRAAERYRARLRRAASDVPPPTCRLRRAASDVPPPTCRLRRAASDVPPPTSRAEMRLRSPAEVSEVAVGCAKCGFVALWAGRRARGLGGAHVGWSPARGPGDVHGAGCAPWARRRAGTSAAGSAWAVWLPCLTCTGVRGSGVHGHRVHGPRETRGWRGPGCRRREGGARVSSSRAAPTPAATGRRRAPRSSRQRCRRPAWRSARRTASPGRTGNRWRWCRLRWPAPRRCGWR